jgi:hypothetical protein
MVVPSITFMGTTVELVTWSGLHNVLSFLLMSPCDDIRCFVTSKM